MINRISKFLAIFYQKNEIDVYVYGCEFLISSIVDFGIA
jgi:hypothetical protein